MAELLAAVGIITQINANRVWQMLESATTENLLEVLWLVKMKCTPIPPPPQLPQFRIPIASNRKRIK